MMKTKKTIMAFTAVIAFAFAGLALVSCKKEEDVGMNEHNAFYSYSAESLNKDLWSVAAEFNYYIENEVGTEAIRGGADEDVIRVCEVCYKHIKDEWEYKSGTVSIIKKRHPDGKQKSIKNYKF